MSTIDWLLRKHKSDKETFHGYGYLYEEYFNPLKDEEITLFEIGVQGGHSIKAWVDYFENGKIIGADIDFSTKVNHGLKGNRESILHLCHEFDAADREELKPFVSEHGKFDIIIDDGGHNMIDQQISLGYLFKYLKPNGIYVIEDLEIQNYKLNEKTFNKFNLDRLGHKVKKENNTLDMIRNIISNKKVASEYMTKKEKKYLENNIKDIKLYDSRNTKDQICFITKVGK